MYFFPGIYGHSSPQPIVTTRSAHSISSSVSPFGFRSADVDPDLLERLDDDRVHLLGRTRAGRARFTAVRLVERLCELRTARVLRRRRRERGHPPRV